MENMEMAGRYLVAHPGIAPIRKGACSMRLGVAAVEYSHRVAGDLIVVSAPKQPVPPGWSNLTSNWESAEKVVAYRIHVEGDPDVRDVWGVDVEVAAFRGTNPVSPTGTAVKAPAITTSGGSPSDMFPVFEVKRRKPSWSDRLVTFIGRRMAR